MANFRLEHCLVLLLVAALACPVIANPGPQPGVAIGPGVGGQVHAIAFDPDDPDVIYAGGDVCGVYKYSIAGNRWRPWNSGLGFNDLNWTYYVDDLLVLGAADGVPASLRGVYAATWGGVYYRPNDQAAWRCISADANYTTGYAVRKNRGHMRIPFSSLAYDATTQTLYAGAGHGRTYDHFGGGYYDFYPTSCNSEPGEFDSCSGEFSLWSCDLSGSAPDLEFQSVPGTDHGRVRQIAVANYTDSTGTQRHEVLYACNAGLWIAGESAPLWSAGTANKSSGFSSETHAVDPWGVVVGSDAICYIVTYDVAGALQSGIWKYPLPAWPRGSTTPDWTPVETPDDYVWPHANPWSHFLAASDGDFTELSIVWNENGGNDALYVGAGINPTNPGYFRFGDYDLDGIARRGWAHIHRKVGSDLGYPAGSTMQVSDWRHGPIDSIPLSAQEVGWHSFDFSMRALVPFAVNRVADSIMVAVDYAVPMLTVDGGSTWRNLYCSGNDASGWSSLGLNLLCPGSSTFLSTGELVIGALDYGVFVGTTPGNNAFRPLHEGLWDRRPDWPSAVDVEAFRRVSDGQPEYYMVDDGRERALPWPTIWTWNPATARWDSISRDLGAAVQRANVREIVIRDIVFAGEDRVYAAVGVQVSAPGEQYKRYHDYICEGRRPQSGTNWFWQQRVDCDSVVGENNESRLINKMCLVPGTDLLMLAAKHKGTSSGGLFPVHTSTWQMDSAWLGGSYGGGTPPSSDIERLGVNVSSIVADRLGRYLYAGTGGGDTPNSPGRGGLVRFPLSNGVPGAPEILAGAGDAGVGDPNAGDVFGIRGVAYFDSLNHGTTLDWEYCTRINDIAIDPNNPRVAYVAVGAGNIPFYHGNFGAWRVSDAGWTHVWGGHETGSGAKTVGISPVDRAHLYVGSVGQEFFRADIEPSSHPDIAANASHPLLAAIADTVQVLAVPIAADTTVVMVEAALDSLGLPDEKLILLDDGQGEDVAEGDGLFTSPRFPALLTAGTGHSVRVFARDATGGYDEREVAVEAVASKARFEDLTEFTGDLATILTEQPYSAVYFKSRPGDPESEDIMIVTFDNDGSLGVGQQPQILQMTDPAQNGAPQFALKTSSWIEYGGLPRGSRGVSYADFDNDGDNDFFLCNPVSGGRLYRSYFAQGMEMFTDVTNSLFGPDAAHLAQAIAASWGDYNADGYADLYVTGTNYFNSVQALATNSFGSGGGSGITYSGWIFRNRGGDAFTKTLWGSQGSNNVLLGACWADLDNDGDLDLIAAKYIGGPIRVLENAGFLYSQGDHVMGESGWRLPLSDPDGIYGANSVTVFDYDHDPYPDLLVTFATHDGDPKVKILRNNFAMASREFTPIEVATGTEWNGATVADFNLDGQEDILLHPRAAGVAPALLLADGYGTSAAYRDIGFAGGLRGGATGGAVAVDFDRERNIDLYLGRGEGTDRGALYRNIGQAAALSAWLEVRPRTVSGGYGSLVGTKVVVEAPGRRWQKTIEGGSGRGGQAADPLLFGLGDVTGNVTVTVSYPSGEVDGPLPATPNAPAIEIWENQPVVLASPPPKQNLTYDYEFGPGTADWIFRWRTNETRGDPALDQVVVWNYSNYDADGNCGVGIAPDQIRTLAPSDPEVEHLVYRVGTQWQHELRWLALPCGNNCQYKFRVTSGLGSQSQTSNWVNMSTSTFCVADPGDPGDPNQQ